MSHPSWYYWPCRALCGFQLLLSLPRFWYTYLLFLQVVWAVLWLLQIVPLSILAYGVSVYELPVHHGGGADGQRWVEVKSGRAERPSWALFIWRCWLRGRLSVHCHSPDNVVSTVRGCTILNLGMTP